MESVCSEGLCSINYLGFNQDQTCLAIGTSSGFSIYSTESFLLLYREAFGAVSLVEMLFRTSLLALVGGASARDSTASSSSRRLTMWNKKDRSVLCRLSFDSMIHGVKMNYRRVVVLLKCRIHLFDLKSMKQLWVIDRAASPWADPSLAWLCTSSERGYLATPLALPGSSQDECGQGNGWSSAPTDSASGDGGDSGGGSSGSHDLGLVSVLDTYTLQPVGLVIAHKAPIQALCLNPTGQLLATASTKGVVIRLFAVPSLECVFSFRRGTSHCRIFGLLFSRDSGHLCASSASGTVHIFKNSQKLLAELPLHSEEATVGAAHREIISHAASPPTAPGAVATAPGAAVQRTAATPAAAAAAPPRSASGGAERSEAMAIPAGGQSVQTPDRTVSLGPRVSTPPQGDSVGEGAYSSASEEPDIGDDWTIIDERPERLLELCMNAPGFEYAQTKNAMQALSAVSEFTLEHTVKYARSLLQLLPHPCRELMDAPRAFAWVHLRGDEDPQRSSGGDTSDALLPLMPRKLADLIVGAGDGAEHGGYVACVNLRPLGSSAAHGRAELLVATARGIVSIYDWSLVQGGECRLRTEQAFGGVLEAEDGAAAVATGGVVIGSAGGPGG